MADPNTVVTMADIVRALSPYTWVVVFIGFVFYQRFQTSLHKDEIASLKRKFDDLKDKQTELDKRQDVSDTNQANMYEWLKAIRDDVKTLIGLDTKSRDE